MENRLFVSVDMDEWFIVRWATGSRFSKWQTVEDVFNQVYKSDKPIGEIYEPTEKILELFDSLNFKSTFFFTGLIASYYPDLVKRISNLGHEIACHNFYHLDYEHEPREKFKSDLKKSKELLEDLSGTEVVGYRSPNSSIPNTIVYDLEEAGFKYDSSVTPTRRFMGKFGKFTKAPLRPYRPSYDDISKEGTSDILEFPWAIFPYFKLPAGSGNMHRIMGDYYNSIATNYSLKQGTVSYYFHPFEVGTKTDLLKIKFPFSVKIYLRNRGEGYERKLKNFLFEKSELLVNGINLLKNTILL